MRHRRRTLPAGISDLAMRFCSTKPATSPRWKIGKVPVHDQFDRGMAVGPIYLIDELHHLERHLCQCSSGCCVDEARIARRVTRLTRHRKRLRLTPDLDAVAPVRALEGAVKPRHAASQTQADGHKI